MKTNLLKSIFISLILVMGVSNAWAYDQSAVDLYFDNSTAKWTNCYIYIGHGSYTSCYAMTRVSGTQYLWKLPSNFNSGNKWGGASGWVVCKEKWWNSNGEDIYKFVYHGNNNVTNIRTSAWNATTIYKADGTQSVNHYSTACTVYKWTTSTKSDYTVTINSPIGGTLTVKDFDNTTVTNGTKKVKLTVLKFSASASTGYTFGGVQINDGSSTTTIAAADIASKTYTLTSNVTITPIWTEKTYSVTISAGSGGTVSPSGSKTIGQVTKTTVTATPNANYEFVNWTTTGGVVVANTSSASTTITATAAGTLTANFRSTATNSLTVAAGAGIESVTGSKDPVTLGSTNAITATPKTGYTFSTWTANPAANATFGSATTANTTVTVKNGSVTVTASATENMSTLTTSNQYDAGDPGYEVPAASVNSIGYETTATITATTDDDYTLISWTLTNCTRTDGGADNATTITVRSNGDGKAATVIANYTKIPTETVYLINTGEWGTVKIYHWGGGSCASYPGENMTKTSEQIAGFNVYEYTMQEGTTPTGMLFNCGGDECKTGDLTWQNGKYYAYSKGVWYDTKAEAEAALAPDPLATDVYLAGDMNSWNTTANEFRKATGEATTANVTVNLTAKTYKFQLVIGGTYYGNKGTMKRGGNAVHEGGWSFEDTSYGADCQIVADITGDYTFTWNLDTKKLTVAYPPLPKFMVSAIATNGTVNGIGEYEQGATATLTATPNDGYVFKNWTEGGEVVSTETTYTFTVTEAVELVANFEKAQEETHTVTVSYMCDTTSIKDATTPAVGVETPVSIEAPVIEGYTFQSWTVGDGIKTDNANTANPISITTKATGTYTMTANYTENPCVYFVNTARWTTINAYAWNDSEDNVWPGAKMTKESEQIGGYDVYKYVMPTGKTYDKIIFNNKVGDNGDQTGDLDWVNGKYYVYSAEQWVDKNEVADLLPKPVIYFKNHLGWKNVYVYFFNAENWGDNGASPSGLTEANGRVCKMEKVGETDIYKYDYSEKDFVPGNVIAFTKDKQPNYDNFWQTEAAYRSDYNPNMELFVPQATPNETKNETKYYNKGIWMKYNSIESGYSIAGVFNDWKADPNPLVADGIGGYSFYTDVQLEAQTKYQFKILNINNDWFGKKSTDITSTTTSDIMLEVGSGDEYNVTITPQRSGTHTFTIDLIEGKLLLHVEYPVTLGDYRIVYAEKENGSTYSKFHVAQTIQKGDNTTKFVSAFVDTEKNPYILLQKWNDGWITTVEKEINLTNFHNLKGNGVYNFWIDQTDGEATIHSQIDKYTGSYYIRTNCADGGWRKYLSTQDNAMTYSQKALNHGGYDYYYCKWIQHAGSNISYTIANDYSFSISDTLTTDDIAHLGILPASAYVRFTWNSQTNKLERAYIGESVAIEGEDLKDAIGTEKDALIPSKLNDWQYQAEAQANANTNIQVVADYNSRTQYLKGTIEQPEKVISGNTTRDYLVRLTYDFRTNQLISTLIDNNKISDSISINSIVISREHHNAAQSINITSTGSISDIESATAVMTFEKETLNDTSIAETERALYWVSFPFSVKLSEVTGNGKYGEHWILEEYDGKARSENGCWAEDTYWKYIENSTDKMLYPHMGYVLALDLTKLGEESNVYDENDNFTIHFPSYGGAISQLTAAPIEGYSTIRFPEYKCTINRPTVDGDRRIKDSNWNIIGVPSFANVHDFPTQVGDVNFYYQWNPADDTYSPQPAATFQTMHAYMVQFAGTIDWGAKTAVSPAAIAARRNASNRDQYTLRLVLQQEGKDQDQTFIRLQAGGATNEFDMNVDLSKIINRGANIYSLIGKEEAAANVLPIEESIIPIGLDIAKTGTYTFAMPDGTDGITAILIDYETQTEHNLLTTEYTIDLNKGISKKRFAIRVVPNQVATNIESLFDKNCNQNVQKYIINGQLFIKNNGHIYDIQGRQVK